MYIVNTSFFVEPEVHEIWLTIINSKYLPYLRKKGFEKIIFTKVISQEAEETLTYSLMVDIDDLKSYDKLTGEVFKYYKEIAIPMFGNRIPWFTTLLKKFD